MRSREGATVIEFLVYLSLFSFVAFASMALVVNFWKSYITINKQRVCFINRCVAHDMLLRDLQTAPALKSGWRMRSESGIKWHDGSKEIGWLLKDSSLFRKEGSAQALIARPIQSVHFTIHQSDEIDAVSFLIKDEYGSVENSVVLTKRRLPCKQKEVAQQ